MVIVYCSESPPPLPSAEPAAAAPGSTTLSSALRTSQAASDIESSLSSLAAQLGGTVRASENLQTDFLSAFVQLLQTQAVCLIAAVSQANVTVQYCNMQSCDFNADSSVHIFYNAMDFCSSHLYHYLIE